MRTHRHTYDLKGHAHFITFSCYKRRRLLDIDDSKRIVISYLASGIKKHAAQCSGFVIMPDHVHVLMRFPESVRLGEFVKQLKRMSSFRIKKLSSHALPEYGSTIDPGDPTWQRGYYDFNVYEYDKLLEKLTYMHENPVKAGLVDKADDWAFSSARWYANGRSVGVPIEVP